MQTPTQPIKQLTKREIQVFKANCTDLLEHTRLYGIPKESSRFVIDKMMYYRLKSIKARPELLVIAKELDKQGILFN
jgi:hypothetical protein